MIDYVLKSKWFIEHWGVWSLLDYFSAEKTKLPKLRVSVYGVKRDEMFRSTKPWLRQLYTTYAKDVPKTYSFFNSTDPSRNLFFLIIVNFLTFYFAFTGEISSYYFKLCFGINGLLIIFGGFGKGGIFLSII